MCTVKDNWSRFLFHEDYVFLKINLVDNEITKQVFCCGQYLVSFTKELTDPHFNFLLREVVGNHR